MVAGPKWWPEAPGGVGEGGRGGGGGGLLGSGS